MTFIAPGLLWGIALTAAPVAIHLLSRRRHRALRWAAMDFLLKALSERSRDVRIQDLVLLALRTAAIAAATDIAGRARIRRTAR